MPQGRQKGLGHRYMCVLEMLKTHVTERYVVNVNIAKTQCPWNPCNPEKP
jgi:hypothetical protein